MNGLSLFSGIGGFDLAMERAGINLVGMCEIDKNAQNVLRKRFRNVPLFDDVREVGIKTHEKGSVDVICGGFPCQDLSIAGKRAGLAGERSGLWFEFARVIDELEPGWVVIENVPGLLSSDKGQDFAIILRWLVERGYGVSWRILDAQYFGVPQRRRRVFIVGSLRTGSSSQVLFESESLSGDPKKGSEKGQATAGTFTIRSGSDGGGKGYLGQESLAMTLGGQPQWAYALAENIIGRQPENGGNGQGFTKDTMYTLNATGVHGVAQIVGSLLARDYKGVGNQYVEERKLIVQSNIAHTLRANAKQSLMSGDGVINETLIYANKVANTLAGGSSKAHSDMTSGQQDGNVVSVVWDVRHAGERQQEGTTPTLTSQMGTGGNNVPMVGVRRLTPTECERLQGFPDGWTESQADTARYKQLGNAVAVPVVQWIINRIWKHEKGDV